MEVKRSGKSAEVQKALKDIGSKEIRVGFFETAKYPDGTPIAYVASIQEFGYGPIPPRPFMRPAENQNKDKWLKGIAAGVKAALSGSITVENVLRQVGMVAAGDVQKAIRAVTSPPLAESTVKRKGNSKPLVDTGQMIQAVTSDVVDK